jgi:crotonobetainyl-CoA:carnitine CoA-transferase CaiB-like acyl-CoA transferase
MNERDVLDDPHLAARDFFVDIEDPDTGTQRQVGRAWRASKTPRRQPRHSVRLGEDNEYVYKELLGFNDTEYRRFEELGHIGSDFVPGVP